MADKVVSPAMKELQGLLGEEQHWTLPELQKMNPHKLPSATTGLDPDYPDVPHAPQFRPETPVMGSPGLAQAMSHLERMVPAIRGHINSVTEGPTSEVISDLSGSKFGASDYPKLNVLGMTGLTSKDISINPRLTGEWPEERLPTLGHEVGHAMGYVHGKEIDRIEELLRTLQKEGQVNGR